MNTIVQPGLLDDLVNEIYDNRVYLTPENLRKLQECFPAASTEGKSQSAYTPGTALSELDDVVSGLITSVKNQQRALTASSDPRDHKANIDSYKSIMTMLMKYRTQIEQQRALLKAEEAIVQTLDEVAAEFDLPQLKERYLEILNEVTE